ncbi:LamG-like jellyroll fold domain-containing protein [Aurantibacillus circumpalustris]|uniref:LamG-like jellyroll fold domain-containing protein n=1 Tax=Aurantibacillus circumpalustris TaxID=3036359 RepID=UPI00295B2904|nr:LamG-like jellyroll fold domain-containing protein [Aurantibacillus circumpalustris]
MKTFYKKLNKAFYGIFLLCLFNSALKAQPAGALNFDGINDNINFTYNASPWVLGNAFTIEMWIKLTAYSDQLIVHPGYGCSYCPAYAVSIGNETTCYSLAGNTGKLIFQGSVGKIMSDAALPLGVWTHGAITYDGSVLKMYINGVLQQLMPQVTGTVTTGTNPSNQHRMFGADNGGCGMRRPFNGSVDEFRIWTGARSQYEIQSYMNCEVSTSPASLTANYHFNQGIVNANNTAVSTVTDASISGISGSLLSFNLTGLTSNWVAGAIVNGFSVPVPPLVNINVQGNGTTISDGDITPSITDHTDFNGALTRTFVIQNTAIGNLNVVPYLTGPDATCFSITTLPSQNISGIGSTSFVVTMITGGTKSATLNINCNDGTKPIYDFVITATSSKYEAINFDGVNDYISIPRTIEYDFTIEFWMRSTQTTTNGSAQWYQGAGLVDGDIGGFNDDFGVALVTNKIGFGIGSGGGDLTIFSTSAVNTGQWVHVAATRNSNTGAMNLYINGVLEASGSGSCCWKGAPANLTLGSLTYLSGTGFYNGDMDELRLWNVIRTQNEIQNYMNSEIPNATVGLLNNYHFNEGTAAGNASVTTLVDLSGQNYYGIYNHGNLNNFALTGATSNWITPGRVITNYATPASSLAVINLKGNTNAIANNASTTSTLNFTNFQSNSTRTFVIENTGTGILNINAVQLTGVNASEFSVTVFPSTTLSTSGTTSFVVAFTPTAGGLRSASVQIASTDNATALYSFKIEGNAPPADALGFDGSNDYASRTILTNNTTSVTLQAKVYWYGPNTFPQVVMYNGHSSIRGSGIYVMANGAVQVLYGGVTFTPYNYTLSPNTWVSLSMVVKNGLVECYVNGILVSATSVSNPNTPNAGLGDLFTVGSNPVGSENFSGRIDEVRYWDKALTQCEIQTYLNCEIPGSMPNLLANYHFNQGSPGLNNSGITNIIDDSGNSNDLTLLYSSLTGTFENWVSPGAVTPGFTTTSAPSSSITLSGNSNPIANNSTTVTTLNNTDFVSAASRTFVIQNSNSGTLNIGAPYITGLNASEFSLTVLPSTTLAASATTTFVVAFTPTVGGIRAATVNINNNDCNIPIFNFTIKGNAPLASALNFDGAGDYVNCGTDPSLDITVGTWETWVNLNALTTQRLFFKDLADATYTGMYEIFYLSGNFYAALKIGLTTHVILSTTIPVINTWYHVAATYDGTAFKLYINGILEATNLAPSGPMNPGTGPLGLGASVVNPTAVNSNLNAKMDETRLWNVARTQCEIQSYMNCEIPTTAPGLVMNYHFNQGASNLANSSVTLVTDAAASNQGTVNGFALTGTVSNWVSPSIIANDFTTSVVPGASITVTGNSNPIANNSTTVTTLNFTDFGSASTGTFVIQNSNTGTLNIGVPYLTGLNASEYSITVLPSASLAASATTSFIIAFTPTAGGVRTATVNINNNDCNKPIFNFVIKGTAAVASALNFDGVNDYVDIPLNGNIPVGFTPYTIEAKIKPNVHGMNGIIGWGNYGTLNQTNALRLGPSNTINNYWYGNDIQVTGPNLADGNWHHLAATFDGIARRIYIDGILYGQDFPTAHTVANNANMRIGSTCTSCGGEFFNGSIDEVRVWNIARTECEIQSYKDCEIPTTASGLVLNYHFNQGSAGLNNTSVSTATDASASAITGTLTNMNLTGLSSNWISPGSVANGYSTSLVPTASISITGNSNPISSNSTTVTTLNHTDFGSVATRTFVITNSSGSGTLNISTPYITGINASEFSVTVLPSSSTLSSLANTSFVVAFTPTGSGVRQATLNISNNDCTKPIFNFAIHGEAPPAAALNFDGVDDYIDLPSNNLPSGNNDFTVEFWVKVKSVQAGHKWITSFGTASSGSLLTIGYDASNSNKIRIHHFGPDLIATTASIPQNIWTHVAVNYRGSTFSNEIFINGTFIETLNFGTALTLPTNPAFQIGSFAATPTYCPHMDLDELKVWNRALCAPEIQNNMNCEIVTTGMGLVANYHFNQGNIGVNNSSINTLTDFSGSLNTGTLINTALTSTISNWVAPGAVTSGSSCGVYLDPEINLMGNGISIPDGNASSSTANNTDFGAVCINTVVVRTFSIQNLGASPLTVSSITMSGSSATSFSVGPLSPVSPIAVGSSATFAVTFTTTTSGVKTATLNISSNDCDEALYDVLLTGTCNALPVVSANTSNSVICNTASTSVFGSGAHTYTWTGTIPAVNTIPFSPSTTTNYTVAGTNTLTGCRSTNIAVTTITVNSLPIVAVSTLSGSICLGNTTTLTATNADTYTWSPGSLNGTSITPSPVLTTTYSVIGTNTLTGCSSTNTAAQTITVNAIPSVTATTPNAAICAGAPATLIASGASSYTWLPGPVIGTTVNPIPAGTITYSLTGTSTAGCTSTNIANQLITVNLLPTVTINPLISVICLGGTASLVATGANTYTWAPGGPGTATLTPSPPSNTGYTLSGSSAAGCTNTNIAVQIVTVNALPSVTASTSNSVICNSGTTSLIGLGADTFTWNPFIANATPFSPSATTIYTLSGSYTLTGCTSTNLAVQTISVNSNPTVGLMVINPTVCEGDSPTLTANGAISYTWEPGTLTTTVITPTPVITTVYSLTGSSAAGCLSSNTATQPITVNPLPLVTANASTLLVCSGSSVSLFGSGATTYTWSGSVLNNISFTPSASGSYTVTGTDVNLCQNTATISFTVDPVPSVSANITSTTICNGQSLTLSGNGATTYSWTGGITDGISFTPITTGNYTLSGFSTAGCSNTNVVVASVSINPLPAVTANANTTVICFGDLATLTGSGAVNYTWTGGVSNNTPFTPTTTNSYTVFGEDSNTCSNSATIDIIVNPLPLLTIVSTATRSCEADSVQLTASGASSYTWTLNQTNQTYIVTPTISTTYTVIGRDNNGCVNSEVYTQSVTPCIGTLTAIASQTNLSCSDKKDGQILITTTNSYSNSQITYIWSPATLCPLTNCNHLENLGSGTVNLIVKVTYTLNNILVKVDSLVINPIHILDENGPCIIKAYSGFSPNGDGINDIWQIDNITQFPLNKVTVFNRWGQEVYEVTGYDNAEKSWPAAGEESKLSSNTYFYLIDLGDGSKLIKGWVEVTKN